MSGVPNLQVFGLHNWRGSGGSMWFAPVSQARGSGCDKQRVLAKRIFNKHGLDYVGEFIVGWRDMHHIIDVLFDRTDPEVTQRARARFNELLNLFKPEGYAVYRVNTEFMHRVAQTYGPGQTPCRTCYQPGLGPEQFLAPGKLSIDLTNNNF